MTPLCWVLSLWRWSGHRLCSSGGSDTDSEARGRQRVCSVNSVLGPMMATDKNAGAVTMGERFLQFLPSQTEWSFCSFSVFHSAPFPHGPLRCLPFPARWRLCEAWPQTPCSYFVPPGVVSVVFCLLAVNKYESGGYLLSQWGHVYQMYITLISMCVYFLIGLVSCSCCSELYSLWTFLHGYVEDLLNMYVWEQGLPMAI